MITHKKLQDFLFREIKRGITNFSRSNKKLLEVFSNSQNPIITLVYCSDSRLSGNILLQNHCCNVFEVRNAGNRIRGNEESVLYGITHLKTPFVIVLGHTDCGCIKYCLENYEKEFLYKERFKDIIEIIEREYENLKNLDYNKKVLKIAEENVHSQISYLLSFKDVYDLVKSEEIYVIGAIYENLKVSGRRFRIININGYKGKEMETLEIYSTLKKYGFVGP